VNGSFPSVTNRLANILVREDPVLATALRPISIRQGDTVIHPGEPFGNVFFIEQGIVSILNVTADGRAVEIGLVGTDGLLGAAVLLGARTAAVAVIARSPCEVLQMSASACKAAFDRHVGFREAVLSFVYAFMMMVGQIAACNQLHSLQQRCARWMLIASDRLGNDTIPMTHELLACVLGVRRAGVTVVAGKLRDKGLIEYRHGRLKINERAGLIATACECYPQYLKLFK
jgi:CRP-like cAMP-binding protein